MLIWAKKRAKKRGKGESQGAATQWWGVAFAIFWLSPFQVASSRLYTLRNFWTSSFSRMRVCVCVWVCVPALGFEPGCVVFFCLKTKPLYVRGTDDMNMRKNIYPHSSGLAWLRYQFQRDVLLRQNLSEDGGGCLGKEGELKRKQVWESVPRLLFLWDKNTRGAYWHKPPGWTQLSLFIVYIFINFFYIHQFN